MVRKLLRCLQHPILLVVSQLRWLWLTNGRSLPNPEEAWASIEPVADVGGRIIGLSTANGSGNFFHQLWTGSTAGNNKFATDVLSLVCD